MKKFMSTLVVFAMLFVTVPVMAEGLMDNSEAVSLQLRLPTAEDPGGASAPEKKKVSSLPYRKRVPALAGALSLVWPGAGQLYNEQYVIGGLWMAANAGLYIAAFAYTGAFDKSEKFQMRIESVVLLAVAGGLHVFSIFDAITEAVRVNKDLKKFSLGVNPHDGAVNVAYRVRW